MSSTPGDARILYVEEGGTGSDCQRSSNPCGSVQAALDVARDGDVVRVGAGTFHHDAALVIPRQMQLEVTVSGSNETTAAAAAAATPTVVGRTLMVLPKVDKAMKSSGNVKGGYYAKKDGKKEAKSSGNGKKTIETKKDGGSGKLPKYEKKVEKYDPKKETSKLSKDMKVRK